jgi:hypothetical protein
MTVPSSTSSFERKIPRGPWLRIWVVALSAALLSVAALEGFWRSRGHAPSVIDDEDLWASVRAGASSGGGATLALLGNSQIQVGFSIAECRKLLPSYRTAQLAVEDTGPLAVLFDLADDPSFRGSVICSITGGELHPDCWQDQGSYVRYYHDRFTLNARLNRLFATAVQGRLVFVDPYLDPKRVAEELLDSGRLPLPRYVRTWPDRSRQADYSKIRVERISAYGLGRLRARYEKLRPLSAREWQAAFRAIDERVRRLQQRGGRVAFVNMPSTGDLWNLHEKHFPKALVWDELARSTSATTVHFRDVESLAHFDCPDSCHLDFRDSERFTRALLVELQARGFFGSPSAP